MPRRNKQVKHLPFTGHLNDAVKVRYPNKDAAQRAAEIRMLQIPDLDLDVYQGMDGGWYLTRKKPQK